MSSQVTWKLSLFSVLFGITLAFSIAPCASAQDSPLERVVIKIPLSPVSVECDAKCGIAEFDGDSMAYIALAGEPAVPYQIAHILLPPDADLSSVQATLEQIRTEKMPGEWEVAPTPPLATWDDGKQIIIWPPDKTIVEGRDVAIYESDALFPSSLLGNMTSGYMRQWALVTIPFATYQYNPVQKTLLRVVEADLVVTFARLSPTLAESQQRVAASDTISEESVRRLVVNYEQMAPAYAAPTGESRAAGAGTGYVILTTQAIQRQSGELSSFVANKEKLGFTVHVVTETEWGGGVGDQAAENIRNWLAAHYASLQVEYVLLVGNPDTTTGDIPMKMLWPLHGLGHNEDAPTDYYYSDLTGNWDLDGDGFFGEDPGDLGLGGVDFNWEVLVGRIPFYGSFSDLDHILAKSIAYENAYDDTIAWRKNALLPMMRSDAETPGYHLGEAITNDILAAAGGWRQHRNYEESFGLTPPPESVCDTIPCVGNESKVADIWRGTPFGAVFWWTHGGPTGATYVMDSSLAATLDDGHPSFTFQASCLNAQPEAESNLAYSLLKNGAVGTIGATRVSWYAPGQTSFKNPYTNYTNSGMAYE